MHSVCSPWLLTGSQVDHGLVLGISVLDNGLMVEAGEGGLNVMSLSHLEVLSEVLVSAPPVGVDHADSLVSSHLMEVRVSHVVLLTIGGETTVGVRVVVVLVVISNVPSPFGHHLLLLLLGE